MDEIWFGWWGSSCIPGSYIKKLFCTVTELKETKTQMFTTIKPEKKNKYLTNQVQTPNLKSKWNHSPQTARMCILHQMKNNVQSTVHDNVPWFLNDSGYRMGRVGSIMPSYLTLGLWWLFGMEEEEQRILKATNQKCSGWMRQTLMSGDALCCTLTRTN